MAEIELSRGLVALVDDTDFDWLSRWTWYAAYAGSKPGVFYARRNCDAGEPTFMHALILPVPAGCVPDHRNGNRLDNRRSNLRVATYSQNAINRRLPVGVSGFRGVGRRPSGKPWQAKIRLHGKDIYLGLYWDAEEAARAYDAKAREIHGEFASLNFPDEAP